MDGPAGEATVAGGYREVGTDRSPIGRANGGGDGSGPPFCSVDHPLGRGGRVSRRT